MRQLLFLAITVAMAACSTADAAADLDAQTGPDDIPPAAICAEAELDERLECADDAYADYVSCSMTTGGTGSTCEVSAGPADCMNGYVAALGNCDDAWPECSDPVADEVLPDGFMCLLELYECRVGLDVCDQAGQDACTSQHYDCALG